MSAALGFNWGFAVTFTLILYLLGVYLFMLPAYLGRLRHPRAITLRRLGIMNRIHIYTAIYLFSPVIFIFFLLLALLKVVIMVFSVVMLMVMSPFHWLFSLLPFDPDFSLLRPWKRVGGRMFELSRKMFFLLAGEETMQRMKPIDHPQDKK
jgi:hypothetical protein